MPKGKRLTLARVEKVLGLKATLWAGQCFGIASQIVRQGLVEGRAVYGHYRGPVHPDSRFFGKSGTGFVKHGWIALQGGAIMDPTRWVFECKTPYLHWGPLTGEYDEGGNGHRAAARPPPDYDPDEQHFTITEAVMASPTWSFVEHLLDLDPEQPSGELTLGQLVWLAHSPPAELAEHAAAVHKALAALGLRAFVPIDNRRMVEAQSAPTVHRERAFHPLDAGNAAGGLHLVLDSPLKVGRLERAAGDALCKPRRKFWGLYKVGDTDAKGKLCPKCSSIASRYGLGLVP